MNRALADDPWSVDHHYAGRIQLALSILGHADPACWQQQIGRAVLALEGKSIDEILAIASAETPISRNLPPSQWSLFGNSGPLAAGKGT